ARQLRRARPTGPDRERRRGDARRRAAGRVGGRVGIWAGPYVVAAVVLAIGGALKVSAPETTARALAGVGLRIPVALVAAGGGVEVGVGVGALAVGTRPFAVLVAVSYAAFAAFVAVALVRGVPISSCGCFGREDTPPTGVHVAVDVGLAAVATAVAGGRGGTLAGVVRAQPLAGVPFLVLTAACVYLVYIALTVLPRVLF